MKYLLAGEHTNRLIFRLSDPSFFDSWLDFYRHPDAARFLSAQDTGTPYEKCKQWFRRIEERYSNDLGGMNALINRNTNEFMGYCGLLIQEVDGMQELEIGYSILPRFWNQGYATEAAIKCRDYAFENSFSETLISIIHVENKRSEKVALKNSMIKTKLTEFRKMPVNIFMITKPEWLGITKKYSSFMHDNI